MQGNFYVDLETFGAIGSDPIKECFIIRSLKRLQENFNKLAVEGAKSVINDYISTKRSHSSPLSSLPSVFSTYKKLPGPGNRFVYQGILLELAIDPSQKDCCYGSDEFAMKAVLHETKGYTALLRMSDKLWRRWSLQGEIPYRVYVKKQGLFIPLVSVIDYLGFRVIATEALNLKGTLVYGIEDNVDGGGETPTEKEFHNKDAQMAELMETINSELNLRAHQTKRGDWINGPFHLQGHIIDGRRYVLGLKKLMPPEFQDPNNKSAKHCVIVDLFSTNTTYRKPHMCYLLRPELVKKCHVPHSYEDLEDQQEHTRRIQEATRLLHETIIPSCVGLEKFKPTALGSLADNLKLMGINMRSVESSVSVLL